jgi:hypothetical protein
VINGTFTLFSLRRSSAYVPVPCPL